MLFLIIFKYILLRFQLMVDFLKKEIIHYTFNKKIQIKIIKKIMEDEIYL